MISNLEMEGLCRSLSELVHAGIGAGNGLALLAEEEPDRIQKELLLQLAAYADCGISLSEAFCRSGQFPSYVCILIQAGELTGKLEQALRAVAEDCEKKRHTAEQLRTALFYPALLFLVMLAVIGVLLTRVLPVFDSVYGQLGGHLTGAAGILLSVGMAINRLLPVFCVLLALGAVGVLCVLFQPNLRSKSYSVLVQRLGSRGVGGMLRGARSVQVLAMGMESGLPLEETLRLAAELNAQVPELENRFLCCSRQLAEGKKVSEAFRSCRILPGPECRLLEAGLMSGNGDRVMGEIAGRMQERAEAALQRRIGQAEPAMVLAASLLIGMILLSVMLPLIHIMSALG